MPSSVVRTFTDPDAYFAGIRNLQIEAVVLRRGEFHAEATRIDLHRLWMHRFDESLPRIMRVTPSGMRAGIVFASAPGQQAMQINGIEIARDQIPETGWIGLLPSILCGLQMAVQCLWCPRILPPRANPSSDANC